MIAFELYIMSKTENKHIKVPKVMEQLYGSDYAKKWLNGVMPLMVN